MSTFCDSLHAFAVRRFLSTACVVLFSGVYASATPVTFTGEDLGAGQGSAHPNSSAVAASFALAAAGLGTISTINFESAALGAFSSLTAAPGVTVTGSNVNGANQTILNASAFPSNTTVDGFNTTASGANFLQVTGGTVTFTFAVPTSFFGAYLSGIQTGFFQDTVTFSDGSSQTILVPGAGTTSNLGALDFVGFTDPGASITSVTINAGNSSGYDAIGVDDVSYQSASATAVTPEPESLLLVMSGVAGLGTAYRRFRSGR